MGLIHIGGKSYELVHENRNGWNPEAFRNRYSEVLERYDFIIGDWGYNQLRLKGFFRDNHQKANKDCTFSGITDYINEYCNFGCAYFILEKKSNGAGRETEEDDLDLNDVPAAAYIRLDGQQLRAAAETAAAAVAEGPSGAAAVSQPASGHRHRNRGQHRSDGQEAQGRHATGEGRNASGEARNASSEARNASGEGRHATGEGRNASGEARNASGEGRHATGEGRNASGEGRRRDRDHHFRKGGGNRNHDQRSHENRNNEHRGKRQMKAAATAEPGRSGKDAGRS